MASIDAEIDLAVFPLARNANYSDALSARCANLTAEVAAQLRIPFSNTQTRSDSD